MQPIYHAIVLNLHQPAGNLEYLLEHNEWEAKEILWALDRMPRAMWPYEDIARVHLNLSGILLETLSNPEFQSRVYGIIKCGDLLWHLQNGRLFEIFGSAYYHPVLPLIPEADREEHLVRWLGIARHIFNRGHFNGFWPPEMGFSMELIPLLKKMGYRYVMVDSKHVEPIDPMDWHEIRYRPHIAEYEGEEIIVVVRDRELSDAQESGMEFGWFEHEAHERTRWCNFPPLITTATDGDNGGWFRNTNPKSNFWQVFHNEYMNQIRNDWTVMRPMFISEYLDRFGAHGRVHVHTAAWNTGWHHGVGFVQWTGSQLQKDALARVKQTSDAFHSVRQELSDRLQSDPRRAFQMQEAHWYLLRAETSCNFFWGEDWVHRCHEDLDRTWFNLDEARK